MKKILKFLWIAFLILFLVAALTALGYWGLIIKGWPWWIVAVMAAGGLAVFVAIRAVKKFLVRQNEKKFVRQVIHEESEKAEKSVLSGDGPNPEDMEAQWKAAVERLKKSHLRRFGNPLYVLPWYIVMGESRSGKTSAIKHSGLSSTLTDVSSATIVSGTKNCDWWFLEQAIVLDTAGRYTIPIQEEADKKEWQLFLTLLSKCRKKEPVNGAIVTVAADSLLGESPHALGEKASAIRQRINQMMRIMGAKFPVYLLVTKMDLVNGFTDFCGHVSEQRYSQVMGYFNHAGEKDSASVLETCMSGIHEQIRDLRSHIFHNRINPFAVSFAGEFMALNPGLEVYVNTLFSEDVYQATPFFRGIYFSSACRKGAPASKFLRTAGISYDHDASPDSNKSYFLKNFFGAILPKDRNVFTTLTEFLMWKRATVSLAVFSMTLVLLGMSGVLAFSFVNNQKTLEDFDPACFRASASKDDPGNAILLLDRQGFEIDKLAANNRSWILPRMGLHQSLHLEKQLKKQFLADVRDTLIAPLDELFFEQVATLNSQTPYTEVVDNAVYAVNRISLLNRSVERGSLFPGKAFEKSLRIIFPRLDPSIDPAVAQRFASVYADYLHWNTDRDQKRLMRNTYRKMLSQIAERSANFNWMVSSQVCTAADILVEDFIKGHSTNQSILSPKAFISGAFTKAGRLEVERFISMIRAAFTDADHFDRIESDFWDWYAARFYNEWLDFASVFPPARSWPSLVDNWADLATLMTGNQNPYFLLLSRMADEIQWMKQRDAAPPLWARAVLRIKEVKQLAQAEKEKQEGSIMAKISLTRDKLSDKLEKAGQKAAYNVVDMERDADLAYNLKFAGVWNSYVKSLGSLSEATAYNEKCFHMFADYFKALSDPSKQGSPFSQTYEDLGKLKAFLAQNDTEPAVIKLIAAPFEFMTLYGVTNTVAYLQKKWEEIVLSAAVDVDPDNYHSIMFDKATGVVWKFANQEAGPFIEPSKLGYTAKSGFGHKLPFNSRFFKLLSKGEKLSFENQNQYPVSIKTAAVEMNRSALIRSYTNTLTLECADKKTVLINNNFPETAQFLWKPSTCGDVFLSVEFPEMTMKKSWPGKLGFARFLSDFADGSKRFSVADFPKATGYLTHNKVTDINVSYKIRGLEPVLKFLNRRPPVIPEVIFSTLKQKRTASLQPMARDRSQIPLASNGAGLEDHYKIIMKAVPMGTNEESLIKPVSGIFWLNCEDRVVRFENNNYPASVTFDWKPKTCGRAVLIVHFPEFAVVKEYPDFLAFARDFGYKSRTFTVDEFPEQKEALLKKGVTAIHMSYHFKGNLPLLHSRALTDPMPAPKQAPEH